MSTHTIVSKTLSAASMYAKKRTPEKLEIFEKRFQYFTYAALQATSSQLGITRASLAQIKEDYRRYEKELKKEVDKQSIDSKIAALLRVKEVYDAINNAEKERKDLYESKQFIEDYDYLLENALNNIRVDGAHVESFRVFLEKARLEERYTAEDLLRFENEYEHYRKALKRSQKNLDEFSVRRSKILQKYPHLAPAKTADQEVTIEQASQIIPETVDSVALTALAAQSSQALASANLADNSIAIANLRIMVGMVEESEAEEIAKAKVDPEISTDQIINDLVQAKPATKVKIRQSRTKRVAKPKQLTEKQLNSLMTRLDKVEVRKAKMEARIAAAELRLEKMKARLSRLCDTIEPMLSKIESATDPTPPTTPTNTPTNVAPKDYDEEDLNTTNSSDQVTTEQTYLEATTQDQVETAPTEQTLQHTVNTTNTLGLNDKANTLSLTTDQQIQEPPIQIQPGLKKFMESSTGKSTAFSPKAKPRSTTTKPPWLIV